MRISHYWNLLLGKINVEKPAKFTLRNILAVLQSWKRKQQYQLGGFALQQHIFEQIIWRRSEVMQLSPKCWSQGYCKICGCDVLGKTMEDRACEGACYPEMMDKDKWENFKNIHKIKLFE